MSTVTAPPIVAPAAAADPNSAPGSAPPAGEPNAMQRPKLPGEKVEPKEETPPPPQRFKGKYKVDNKEIEEEATIEELWADRRKAKAADKRFEEAAKQRAENEQQSARIKELESELIRSPMRALVRKGYTEAQALDILEKDFNSLVAEEAKSPQTRELEHYRRMEEQRQAQAEQSKSKEAQKAQEQEFLAELEDDGAYVGRVLEHAKLKGLPRDGMVFEALLKEYYSNKKQGIGLSEGELAKVVFDRMTADLDGAASTLTDDEILDRMPKLAKRIGKAIKLRYDKRRAEQNGAPIRPAPGQLPRNGGDGPKVMTEYDMQVAFGMRPPRR